MSMEVIGAAVAVIGVLLWIRRDLRQDIGVLRDEMGELRQDVRALNGRIDNILLADRRAS